VEDNLRLGAWRSRELDPTHVYEVLPALPDLRHRRAGSLSGGQQQMAAVGRALMARPDEIAVDELSLGLAPLVVDDRIRHLVELDGERGAAARPTERGARLAGEACARACGVEAGEVAAGGDCAALAQSAKVARADLGGSVDAP